MVQEVRPFHRLTEVDREARTAVCSVCGPTRIRVRKGKGNQCWTLRTAEREAHPEWSTRTPEVNRARRLRIKYGITPADYEAMFLAQGGRCAICREPARRTLNVDHDHSTGMVRALLCHGCNTGIGHFGEDVIVLQAALDYLKAHRPG